VKLTNAIAYAAQGADLWRIGAKKRRVQFAGGISVSKRAAISSTRSVIRRKPDLGKLAA
jgi:hypothetical protein